MKLIYAVFKDSVSASQNIWSVSTQRSTGIRSAVRT